MAYLALLITALSALADITLCNEKVAPTRAVRIPIPQRNTSRTLLAILPKRGSIDEAAEVTNIELTIGNISFFDM